MTQASATEQRGVVRDASSETRAKAKVPGSLLLALLTCVGVLGLTSAASGQPVPPPTISKAFGAAHIPILGSTTLSFTVTNPTVGTLLTGVGFTDTLPAGLVVSTPNGLTGSCGVGTITATAGSNTISLSGATLAGGASCTFSANVTGATAGVKNNSVTVTSNEGGTGNTATASITVMGPPSISKNFEGPIVTLNFGEVLRFTLSNPNSTLALTGVGFTDTLPAGLVVATPNSVTSTCFGTTTATAGSGTITLSGGVVFAGSSCTVSVLVTAISPGLQINTTSTVTSTEGGTGNTATASITVVGPPTINKVFGQPTVPLGGSTSLSFTIQNNNTTVPLTGIAFTDTLPVGLIISTPNGFSGGCGAGAVFTGLAGSNSITLSGGTVGPSGACNFAVNVTGTIAGFKDNSTSTVTSTEGGTGNSSSASINVVAPPTLTKTFGTGTINFGGKTSLTFVVTNPNSTVALTGIGFTDTLPAGLVVSTPNGLTNSCGGTATAIAGSGVVSLSGVSLPASGICSLAVDVNGTGAGSLVNTTSAVASVEGGQGDPATATLTVLEPIPTLGGWGLLALVALLGVAALLVLRRSSV